MNAGNSAVLVCSFLVGFTMVSGLAYAQGAADEPQPSTTLLSGDLGLGGVAEVGAGVTTAFGLAHPTFHAGASLVIDRRWLVGGFWQRTLGEQAPDGEVDARLYYDMTLVGARVARLWKHESLTPLGVSLAAGWGEVDADLRERFVTDDEEETSFGEDDFFWVEPALAAHLRVVDYAHLRLEAGYRIAGGVAYRAATSADTSGVFVRVSLLGGFFGHKPDSR